MRYRLMSNQTTDKADVLFYVLNSTEPEKRELFLGKLLKKIQQEQRQCDVRFEQEADAQRFDITLWNIQPESFIPHGLNHSVPAAIQLFAETIDRPCQDVLVNLHPEFPKQFSDYQRTIEILDQTEHLVQMGRERWKAYKAQGLEPTVHKIGF